MKIFFAVCAILGVCLVLAAQTTTPQPAPTESPALVGTATNGPTTIRSHFCEIHLKSNMAIYREDVRVDNPQMKLACELLTVEAPKMTAGKFNRATAETNVVIDWTDEKGSPNHATAEKAVYTYALTNIATAPEIQWQTNSIVVLTGHPLVTNVDGTFEGDPIIWDRLSDVVTSPHFQQSTIYQTQTGTNKSGLFDTTTPKPAKPAK
jgi:lipopolysaccharide export system protein LptA